MRNKKAQMYYTIIAIVLVIIAAALAISVWKGAIGMGTG